MLLPPDFSERVERGDEAALELQGWRPLIVDVLQAIKRLVLRGQILFTRKAEDEMARDDLDEDMVAEAIVNAPAIAKRLRSTDRRTGRREYLYVIVGVTFDGVVIYTKGKILKVEGQEVYYVLISSKRSER